MLSPLQLESQPPKSRTPLLFYNGLKDHFKRESIYKLAAWKWALFGRKRLGRALADLQHCNEQLKTFEPLFLFSSLVTRQDIANMVSAIQSEPHSDTSAFIPHIRVRELTEHGEDGKFQDSPPNVKDAMPTTSLALIQQPTIAQPYVASDISREASLLQSTRIVVEYKYYSTAIDSEERSGPALGASSDICDEGMSQKCWPITQIHQLARLLSEAGSHELHTLPFKGYMNESPESRFAFYFDYPKHASDREPVSLNSLITNLEFGKRLSLPVRFQIAHKIAKALGAFHADGWVHKSINSDSIKFFYNRDGQCLYDRPYLVNFEFSRPETGETQNTFDDDFVKNLYRHPDRQGPPTTQFNKMHDVYALGIVLLEIGVWKSALSIYNGVMATRGSNSVLHPKELQMVFQEYASDCLSHSMGPAYAEAVMTCLSGKLMSFVGQHEFGIMFQKEAIRKIDARQILGITEDL